MAPAPKPKLGDIVYHPAAGHRAIYLGGERHNEYLVWLSSRGSVYSPLQVVWWVVGLDNWVIEKRKR